IEAILLATLLAFLPIGILAKIRPRRDSNPQSSDSKSDALSIRPRILFLCLCFCLCLCLVVRWTACPKFWHEKGEQKISNCHVIKHSDRKSTRLNSSHT